jgi:hypothetical protein
MITITLSKPVLEDVLAVIEKKYLSYRNPSNYTAIGLKIAIEEIKQKMVQPELDLG